MLFNKQKSTLPLSLFECFSFFLVVKVSPHHVIYSPFIGKFSSLHFVSGNEFQEVSRGLMVVHATAFTSPGRLVEGCSGDLCD